MKKKKLTRVMLAVCRECFDNDWPKMLQFANEYNADETDADVLKVRGETLGEPFRRIIGSRNRDKFWNSVCEREMPFDGDTIVNGDSLTELQHAYKLCRAGKPVVVQVDGAVIGTLTPLKT